MKHLKPLHQALILQFVSDLAAYELNDVNLIVAQARTIIELLKNDDDPRHTRYKVRLHHLNKRVSYVEDTWTRKPMPGVYFDDLDSAKQQAEELNQMFKQKLSQTMEDVTEEGALGDE